MSEVFLMRPANDKSVRSGKARVRQRIRFGQCSTVLGNLVGLSVATAPAPWRLYESREMSFLGSSQSESLFDYS